MSEVQENEIAALQKEIDELKSQIDCACNALTDSILCSGNDIETNMHFVRKLRKLIK